ncbi:MAG TPA: alpha/beta fold hydrolase [Casimicrobiaceae bacterium]
MWTAVTLWVALSIAVIAWAADAAHAIASGGNAAAWIAGAIAWYFGAVAVLTAIYFAIAWLFRTPRPPAMRITPVATLRLVWREYLALAGSAPRMMLYRWLVPDPLPEHTDVPVLLLHGVLCNAGVWHGLARHLALRGIGGVYALSYGPPLASIELFAAQVEATIDRILNATGATQVMIVAHSMGGLVARAYLRRCGAARVARLVTIGTPHHGSVEAWLGIGTSLAQIRPGSAWLAALEREPLPPVRIVSLWSWHDSMVVPQMSARLRGSIEVPLVGIGHNALLGEPAVFARVEAEIAAARRPQTGADAARAYQ